ncbi:MAG: hypothetical protein KIT35_10540 [Piscinibacter sp.]|uniref:alpha/beta hydrolase family protein n=1 Tax=Piscinibacter sp. TaxID=1903157 RepID=UPI00258F7776|nr:hypothetical protein [Piscinibacter sp.]MCW5664260.1 hypothetical protein [Piscinibacter sp.]
MRRRHLLTLALAGLPRRARPAAAFVDETWTDPARSGRALPLRLRWPAGDGPCAAVIHSHGLGGNRAGGAAWGEAWQAAGFAVIHLQHPGSDTDTLREDGLRGLRRAAGLEAYLQRVRDAQFVLDELQRRRASGGPWARLRPEAIGFSGHSFGARLTQVLAGERPPRAPAQALERLAEPRLRAFIAFSPGFGERDGLDEAAVQRRFGAITRPFLCVTGTRDDAMVVGDASNAARRAVYRGLPPGRRAQLVLDGADHMSFGGGSGVAERPGSARLLRRAPGAADLEPEHQRLVAAVTTDWWRWTLLGDGAARGRLDRPAGLAPGDLWQIG